MAGAQEQMAQYTNILLEHTQNQGIPVTEIVIFKLKQPFTEEISHQFKTQIFSNSNKAIGITRAAWGHSLSDPKTLVWMMDWKKIEDHWAFWQTDNFLPVMAGINDLFVEGRPLVRHYNFEPQGMLHTEFMRVVVWDEKEKRDKDEVLKKKDFVKNCLELKGGFAIDMQEDTWFCTLLGFQSSEEAQVNVEVEAAENHVVHLEHFIKS